MKSEETARRRGQKLLNSIKLFNKADMILAVWESLGSWHYAVYVGAMCIFPTEMDDKHEDYAILMSNDIRLNANRDGFREWAIPEGFRDPNKAIQTQLLRAQQYVDGLQHVIDYMQRKVKRGNKKK